MEGEELHDAGEPELDEAHAEFFLLPWQLCAEKLAESSAVEVGIVGVGVVVGLSDEPEQVHGVGILPGGDAGVDDAVAVEACGGGNGAVAHHAVEADAVVRFDGEGEVELLGQPDEVGSDVVLLFGRALASGRPVSGDEQQQSQLPLEGRHPSLEHLEQPAESGESVGRAEVVPVFG